MPKFPQSTLPSSFASRIIRGASTTTSVMVLKKSLCFPAPSILMHELCVSMNTPREIVQAPSKPEGCISALSSAFSVMSSTETLIFIASGEGTAKLQTLSCSSIGSLGKRVNSSLSFVCLLRHRGGSGCGVVQYKRICVCSKVWWLQRKLCWVSRWKFERSSRLVDWHQLSEAGQRGKSAITFKFS
ncbi:hypothetical protein BDZ45DRAFT_757568, partial [Acephala macrosclerotiorum]